MDFDDLPKPEVVDILQMIPAEGWTAHFSQVGQPDSVDPVVCFALMSVQRDGAVTKEVVAMIQTDVGIEPCIEIGNFSHVEKEGYDYEFRPGKASSQRS